MINSNCIIIMPKLSYQYQRMINLINRFKQSEWKNRNLYFIVFADITFRLFILFCLLFLIQLNNICFHLYFLSRISNFMKSKPLEIIKDRLYWITSESPPKNIAKSFYFNIDDDLQYQPFYLDFGPLSLGKAWKYVTQLQKLLNNAQYKKSQIYHHTRTEPAKTVNAAFLMGAFQIIILGYTADKAYQPFKHLDLVAFRDASYNKTCSYKCTLLDCLRGLDYAIKLRWFNYKKFDLAQYQHYQKVQNGDLNWIIPEKFVAFSSPYEKTTDKHGNRVFTPLDYVPIFKKLGVTMVIRLNNATYEAKGFTNNGIKHHDLFFTDGTPPPPDICQQFLQIVQKQKGAVAVHCKAGLGRTGSLIACYAMKHYRFSAADFIGWIRIARPGSILGPQQHFLIQIQKQMFKQGQKSSIWKEIKQVVQQRDTLEKLNVLSIKSTKMDQKQKEIQKFGDIGQGENLVQAKMKRQQQLKYGTMSKQKRSGSKSSKNSGTNSPLNSPGYKKAK